MKDHKILAALEAQIRGYRDAAQRKGIVLRPDDHGVGTLIAQLEGAANQIRERLTCSR